MVSPGVSRGTKKLDVPCCMPTCNFVTYALIDGGQVTPITRVLDVESHLDYISNRTLPSLNDQRQRTRILRSRRDRNVRTEFEGCD